MKPHHVYHLVDPETRAVRYVGKSANPKSRLRQHIDESQRAQNTEKKRWIRGLIDRGLSPALVIVSTHSDEASAREAEARECETHLATLTNLHDPRKGACDFRKRACQKP